MTISGAGSDKTIIDANNLDRVFDVSGNSTLDNVDLSGGGNLTVESGQTLTLAGNVTLDDVVLTRVVSDERLDVAVVNWKFPPVTVLVVDDGNENRELVRLVLENAGLNVIQAENGEVALQRIAGEAPGIVLLDLKMPVLDGYAATTHLRQTGYGKPIVALTAHAMSDDRKKCLDAGCDDYASKPIDRGQLIEVVARWTASPVSGRAQET